MEFSGYLGWRILTWMFMCSFQGSTLRSRRHRTCNGRTLNTYAQSGNCMLLRLAVTGSTRGTGARATVFLKYRRATQKWLSQSWMLQALPDRPLSRALLISYLSRQHPQERGVVVWIFEIFDVARMGYEDDQSRARAMRDIPSPLIY